MSDGLGVRVWRFKTVDGAITYRTYKPSAAESEPGLWLSLDPKKRAEYREALEAIVRKNPWPNELIDQFLAVLIGGER